MYNMHSLKYFFTLLTSLATLHLATAREVALGMNSYLKPTEKKVLLKANSFIELISKGVFIDKTLLIDAILSNSSDQHMMCLTIPNHWGKTINLDMLKTFLEIQIHPNGTKMLPVSSTPNYQLFTEGIYRSNKVDIKLENPLLISNKKYTPIIDKYLGQHPVIYLSFAGLSTSGNNSMNGLREIIAEAFRQHEYMLDVYNSIIENEFNNEFQKTWAVREKFEFMMYLNKDASQEFRIMGSLRVLCEKLRRHFESRVFILIDDYDQYLRTNVTSIIENMFYFVLEDNDDVERSVITGALPIQSDFIQVLSQFLFTPFYTFYGFTTNEMNLIYSFYQIPQQEQIQIQNWYGGYRTSENHWDEIFNPWSVCNYVNTRQLKAYWPDANFRDKYLNEIRRSSSLRDILELFVTGKDYSIRFSSSKFTYEELTFVNETSDVEIALKYLFAAGYLTITNTSVVHSPRSHIYTYGIPNHEIMNYLTNVRSLN